MSQPIPTNETPFRYTAALANAIEVKWQLEWDRLGTFVTPNPGQPGFDASRPKFYCLDMFPYPSGSGLHVGHPEGYTATDIISRYKRMKGFNVLHPMGWDAFGLPAEQYAIQTGVHPAITTKKAIENFRRQLQRFGFSYDWSREFGTIDPSYYKWTQWIFLKLYDAWFDPEAKKARPIGELVERETKAGRWAGLSLAEQRKFLDDHRLVYLGETTVNWCPKLGTVLANDEVIDGRSERGGHPVLRKPMKQWMFRITAYADRLLDGLAGLDWPSSTKAMQTEWIGRSEGAEIEFEIVGLDGGPALRAGPSPSALRADASRVPSWLDDRKAIQVRPLGFVARDPYPASGKSPPDLKVSVRRLPHILLDHATYFVTWRTRDGVTLSERDRGLVLDAMQHWHGKRAHVYAACVLPDHAHWIVRPFAGESLLDLCESVKKFSATQVNKANARAGSMWQDESFDHIVRDHDWFAHHLMYLLQNPVEAGLCDRPSDYAWTSLDGCGIIDDRGSGGSESRPTKTGTECRTTLTVFTTRPDTLFGATYMVVAPEHPLVASVLTDPAVKAYVERAKNLSDIERMENKKKTGVFSGLQATNPATGETIPVWIADYVLMGYGTGAIMAVPAHDERDYEFAKAFGLPIRDVVYDRTRVAMAYFAKHAPAHARTAERWQGVLADFLGSVTSAVPSSDQSRDLSDALQLVTARRESDSNGTAVMIPAGAPVDRPGGIGERRGATSIIWLDAIAEMNFDSFDDFVDRFARGRLFDVAGGAFVATGAVGVAVNSSNSELSLDGLTVDAAKAAMVAWLERKGVGRRRVNYKFRDWTFSRQRYWGEPFPMVFAEDGTAYPVSEKALPVTLPELADYAPVESDDPMPLLGKVTQWVHTTAGAAGVDPAVLPPSTKVRRESNTMPGSAGSSWYALRYCDVGNDAALISPQADRYWMGANHQPGGVDLYMGGSEHAVGHLMYSRFWQNVLHDLGHVTTPEPFQKLFHQGLITSFAYQRPDKTLVPCDEVEEPVEGQFVEKGKGTKLTPIVAKMSKSLKNVVNPDDVIAEFGADTFRLYEMYMGPLEASKPWNPRDITGLARFLARAWRVAVDEKTGAVRLGDSKDMVIEKQLHRTVAKVGADIERLSFNTAIAAMIEFVNAVGTTALTKDQVERFMLTLAPFAPHVAEEVWSKLGHAGMISLAAWPTVDPAMLVDDQVELAVQIQGKVRCKLTVPNGADATSIEAMALADPEVQKQLAGKAVKKIIVVPGRLVNIVAV